MQFPRPFTLLWIILAIAIIGGGIAAGLAIKKQYSSESAPTPTITAPITPTPDQNSAPQNQSSPSDTASNTNSASGATSGTITTPLIQEPPATTDKNVKPVITGVTPSQTLPTSSKGSYLPLSKVDCENECKQYPKDPQKEYCRQYCGLDGFSQSADCESLKNLEKDYCYKNQAVEKTDFSICEKVKDKNILATCQNRVSEAIVDQSHKN
jgi:hypothetical protein